MTPSEFKPDVWYRLPGKDWDVQWRKKSNSWHLRDRMGYESETVMLPDVITCHDWQSVETLSRPNPWVTCEYPGMTDLMIQLANGTGISAELARLRIVACVRAMDGIADPEAWVREQRGVAFLPNDAP